jgi:hypothetical protein
VQVERQDSIQSTAGRQACRADQAGRSDEAGRHGRGSMQAEIHDSAGRHSGHSMSGRAVQCARSGHSRQEGRQGTGDQKVRGEGSAEQAESRAKQCKQAVKAGKGRAGS